MSITATFTGIGDLPRVLWARTRSARTVEVAFSESMTSDATLIDPATYTITPAGGSAAVAVIAVSPNATLDRVTLTVDVHFTVGFSNYTVAVDDAVIDLAENTLDPDYDEAVFSVADYTIGAACSSAKARLLEQFKGKPDIEALVCAFATPADDLNRALENIRGLRSLDTAFGVQLDKLGQLYRRPRGGKDDTEYRRFLRASASKAGSRGTAEDLLSIAVALDDGFAPARIKLLEHHPASLIITSLEAADGQIRGEEVGAMLRATKAAGVRFVFMFELDGATHFVWSGDTGEGFAEEDDPIGTGGVWAEGV